jgi:hypothetical protein
MDKETWEQVERMHALIPMGEQGPCNFLTLVCTGHTTGWAASFDFNLDDEWYEAANIGRYPFAARAETAGKAIELAALRVYENLLSAAAIAIRNWRCAGCGTWVNPPAKENPDYCERCHYRTYR